MKKIIISFIINIIFYALIAVSSSFATVSTVSNNNSPDSAYRYKFNLDNGITANFVDKTTGKPSFAITDNARKSELKFLLNTNTSLNKNKNSPNTTAHITNNNIDFPVIVNKIPMHLRYTITHNQIKEELIIANKPTNSLLNSSSDTFSIHFSMQSHNLIEKKDTTNGQIDYSFTSPDGNILWQLPKPTITDVKNAKGIIQGILDSHGYTLQIPTQYLTNATYPVIIDPTVVINTSSLTTATAVSTERHIVKTSDGTIHTFIQTGSQTASCGGSTVGGLLWFNSTDSGATWTCQAQINSSTSLFASATLDSSDNIYIAYSQNTNGGGATLSLFYRMLTKGSGATWTVGSEQTVLSGSASVGYHYAVLEIEGTTRLWLASRYFDGTNYQVTVYYSDGLTASPTWTQSIATLDTAGTTSSRHEPTIVRFGSSIGVIYNDQALGGQLKWRYRADSDGLTSWNTSAVVTSSTANSAATFSAIGDTSGNVYVASNSSTNIFFTYWNSSSWSTTATVSSAASTNSFVSVTTDGTSVWVAYRETTGITLNGKLVYRNGVSPFATANFDSTSTSVNSYQSTFDQAWVYNNSANTYEDVTTVAANTTANDVVHSSSGRLVSQISDAVYLGKSTTFDAVALGTTTFGTVGVSTWEYCSAVDVNNACTTWSTLSFSPSSNTNFTSNTGYGIFSVPSDWATAKVNSEATAYYYIRARVTTNYTVGPKAGQFTSIPQINWSGYATSTTGRYLMWTENAASPEKVRFSSITTAPNPPTSLGPSGYINGGFTASTQPSLTFSLSDSNGSATNKYEIQISTNSDYSSPTVDYTSALAAQGSTSFTVGQAAGSGSYTTGSSGQTLSTGSSYYWRVKNIDNASLSTGWATANTGVAFQVDATAPSGGSITYTDGYYTTASVALTVNDGTDSGSGIDTTTRIVQRQSATLSAGSCGTFGSFSTITTTGSYPNFTDTSIATNTCYQYRYLVSDLVANQATYTGSTTVKADLTSPTTPGTPAYSVSSATPTKPTWTWTASTDSGSGLTSPAYTVQWCDNSSFTSCSSNTATTTTATYTHTTALTEGTWYFRVTATDLVGNVSSYSNTASIVIDTTSPNSFNLENPEDGAYTNNPRPTFQWRAATVPDAGSGISKYKLSIDNGGNGDFYIDSIPTSGTTDITQANYIIHFDGFSDTDATNNYISVYTKSSSIWSSSQNDGALKEGKRTWTVTAYDNSVNSTSASRALYADFTNPILKNVSLEKICSDGTYAVSLNTSPSISGNLSDNLLPYKIEASFYKKNFFLGFYTSETLIDTQSFIIPNNSGDKELSFSVSLSKALDYGKYNVTIVGLDKAGNHSAETSLNLQLIPQDKAHTQTCIAKQLQNLKQSNTASLDNLGKQVKLQHEEAVNQLNQAFAWLCHLTSSIANAFQETGSTIFALIKEKTLLASHSQTDSSKHVAKMHKEIVVAFQALFSPVNSTIDVVNTHLTLSQEKIQQDIKNNHTQTSLRITQQASKLTTVTVSAVQQPLTKANQFLQRLTAGVNIFYTYVFDNNPTKIVRVQLESIGKNEMTVVWETNQYTINNKLNYGETTSYDKSVWAVDATKIHKVTLKGLKPDTTYKFEVMSQGKNYAYDAYYTVKTKKN